MKGSKGILVGLLMKWDSKFVSHFPFYFDNFLSIKISNVLATKSIPKGIKEVAGNV
jgi:hypothetical protein